MQNIEDFKIFSCVILAFLYESFPTPIGIDIRWIEGREFKGNRRFRTYHHVMKSWDQGHSSNSNENPVEIELWRYHDSLAYLVREGYVSTTRKAELEERNWIFQNCVLTEKGLKQLLTPSFLDRRPLGEKMIEYLKEGKFGALIKALNPW